MAALAFTLEGASLQFFTIEVPLAPPATPTDQEDEEQADDLLPTPLPPRFAALSRALAAVRALNSAAAPFAVHALGQEELRVVTLKPHVAGVFRMLHQRQASCGIVLRDVKSHVAVAPLPAPELGRACACGLLASLLPRGWWQLDEDRLLGTSLLEPAQDGAAQACSSLTVRVHAEPGNKQTKLYLLVRAEEVEFRHPACRPGASLAQRSASLAGAECQLLPDLRPALIQRLRPADEPTLARLRPLWASHGMPLPPQVDCLVEVALDCNPDAPTFRYPDCRVLGASGLLSVASKRSAPTVQAALARLRDDLAATPIKFLGPGLKVGAQAHEWFPGGAPLQPRSRHQAAQPALTAPAPAFITARQHAELSKGQAGGGTSGGLALGQAFDVASFAAAAAGSAAGTQQQRPRRPNFVAGAKLQAAFEEAKRQLAEEERPAAAAAGSARPAPAAPTAPRQQPFALRQAAAAVGGSRKPTVPVFKKAAGAPGPARGKVAATPGKKRAPAAKPPPAPKRPKAVTDTAACAGLDGSVAGATGSLPASSAAAGLPGMPPSSAAAAAGAGSAPPSAYKQAAGKDKARAATAAEGGGMGAAPPPKAPAKPRAKAADVDVAAVTAKVGQMHGAGTLGKLTVPELKAYLRSVGRPVGGKKGELEERVRQQLGTAGL